MEALSGVVEDVIGMLSQGQGLYQCCHHQYREDGTDHASDAEDRKGGMIRTDMSDGR